MSRLAECKVFAHFIASRNQAPSRRTICDQTRSGSNPSRWADVYGS